MANRQNIAYLSDLGDTATVPQEAVSGNVVTFGTERGKLADSGKKPADFAAATALKSHEQNAVAHLSSEEHENLTAQQSAFGLSFKGVSYDSTNKKIVFTRQDNTTADIDATAFIKDGMVSGVRISNGNLVITFNTDAGKEPITIPLTDIFNPSNYYDKAAADGKFRDISDFECHDVDYWVATYKDGSVVVLLKAGSSTWYSSDGLWSLEWSSRNSSWYLEVWDGDPAAGAEVETYSDNEHGVDAEELSCDDGEGVIITLVKADKIARKSDVDSSFGRLRKDIPISSDDTPLSNGAASPGESGEYSRSDHVHPSDASKQDALTFDDTPTANSDNPVKSNGIKTAIDAKYTKPRDGIPKVDLVQSVQDTIDSVYEKRNKDDFSVDNENWVFTDADGNVVCLKPSGVDYWAEDRDEYSEGGWSLQWSSRNSFWVLEYESGGIPDSYTSYDSGSSSVLTFDVDGVDVRVVKGYRIAFDTEIEELKKKLSQMESRLTSLMSGGIYVKEEGANVFHKLVAVKDAETGKVDIGIDQEEGVLQ